MATFKILGLTFCIYSENKIKQEANNAIVNDIKFDLLEEHGPVKIPAKYKPFSIEWHVYKDSFNRDRSKFFRRWQK